MKDFVLKFLWPRYACAGENEHSFVLVIKHWMMQKLLRVNSQVPWPVHPTSKVIRPERIERGTRTPGLSMCCHIDGRNGIKLGRNVWIGPRVSIISMNHDVRDYRKYIEGDPIVIGDNCWLAANCVILPGVIIGPHTIVAAGAVVTRSFKEGDQILAGVPAKVVKTIDEYDG
ncbi:acyltransferase [Halothiobacillus sp.]|uniref:acyltransferase n=1 Tax=Halothiobacillus sp. TaxID=1891311 RepID=UPI002AD2E166|nr:acyltransferase [Halothiobacillus sp.]